MATVRRRRACKVERLGHNFRLVVDVIVRVEVGGGQDRTVDRVVRLWDVDRQRNRVAEDVDHLFE